jgi:polyvinyl alcohol dehydrogenase (cytochrome)
MLWVAALVLLTASCGGPSTATLAQHDTSNAISPWDWPTYGHDAQHTFHGRTTLTEAEVPSLKQAWTFPTGDAVTATPTVVDGVVYVGSWDQNFYALALVTGRMLWKFRTFAQPAIEPYPGENPRPVDSDGGMITSSAWYEPGDGTRPDLVIFGGGYTLYALNAHTGALYWSHAYTGNPDRPPQPATDGARIFSSPVVADGKVLFGLSVDGQSGERGYVVGASLDTGRPDWIYETDTAPDGQVLNNGCGNVWSSGSVLPAQGLVLFDEADCNFSNPPPTAETVFALRISDGSLVWRFRPDRADNQCDWDFGASVNVGLGPDGNAVFAGVGSKDGTYYSLDPLTGHLRWKTNVVYGGFSGGFIATAAYDGTTVYGGTSIGDFGRFEHGTAELCDPSNPRDQHNEQPSDHAFDAATGAVRWQADNANTFGPTTVAGGMTFDGQALTNTLTIRDAKTGTLLASLPLLAPCWSGVATVGDALVLGTGSSENGHPDGVVVYTPGGRAPAVP